MNTCIGIEIDGYSCGIAYLNDQGIVEEARRLCPLEPLDFKLLKERLFDVKQEAESSLEESIKEAVVAVPAYFDYPMLICLKQVLSDIGIRGQRFLYLAEAEALVYGRRIFETQIQAEISEALFVDCGRCSVDIACVGFGEGVIEVRTVFGMKYSEMDAGTDRLTEIGRAVVREIQRNGLYMTETPIFLTEQSEIFKGLKKCLTEMTDGMRCVLLDRKINAMSGAALQAGILQGHPAARGILLLSVFPWTICVEKGDGICWQMDSDNAVIPYRLTKAFYIRTDRMCTATVDLLLGNDFLAANNIRIGSIRTGKLLPSERGLPRIEVVVEVNGKDDISFHVKDMTSGQEWSMEEQA